MYAAWYTATRVVINVNERLVDAAENRKTTRDSDAWPSLQNERRDARAWALGAQSERTGR